MPLQEVRPPSNASQMGFFRLVIETLRHPINSMDNVLACLGSPPMLVKMILFYITSLIVPLLILLLIVSTTNITVSGQEMGLNSADNFNAQTFFKFTFQLALLNIIVIGIYVFIINVASIILGAGGNFLGLTVALAYAFSLINYLQEIIVPIVAAFAPLTPLYSISFVIAFSVWLIALTIGVIESAYGVEGMHAFIIALLARLISYGISTAYVVKWVSAL